MTPVRRRSGFGLVNLRLADLRVKGVRIGCRGEGGVLEYPSYRSVELDHSDSRIAEATEAPLPGKWGLLVRVGRSEPEWRLGGQSDWDDFHATWLMIYEDSGYAPEEWQRNVGPVVVTRIDYEDLEIEDLLALTDALDEVLDVYGEGKVGPKQMSPEWFASRRRSPAMCEG